jgi:hypothetical protein
LAAQRVVVRDLRCGDEHSAVADVDAAAEAVAATA